MFLVDIFRIARRAALLQVSVYFHEGRRRFQCRSSLLCLVIPPAVSVPFSKSLRKLKSRLEIPLSMLCHPPPRPDLHLAASAPPTYGFFPANRLASDLSLNLKGLVRHFSIDMEILVQLLCQLTDLLLLRALL